MSAAVMSPCHLRASPQQVSGTDFAVVAFFQMHQLANEKLMNHLRYVVVRHEAEWTIVQGGRRYSGSYPSKRQAVGAAIEFGEKDGRAGRRVEVLVGHEDGHFLTEWIFGRDPRRDEAARPIVTPTRK
jgi:hypothetical protein